MTSQMDQGWVRNPVRTENECQHIIHLPELLFLSQVAVHYCQDISGLPPISENIIGDYWLA